ncbi:hypothetical protein Mp_8g13810 [Marchantia polymorpha subsp. ruderalis]|uniref:Uncharacterized protein n=1 Tax=Marchantia polymorpha TaxID=3197 RepID=A0A2R6VY49_MARPO|nr:hypothetical protein MARPO_1179s0002 [Marchantia polymorpha]BBN19803.1 hypothetical protein Mp_8g13810 [Marchantia polymorpha subsp. ruderalis]|eukprot:PTQ26523.1 hypothetical protein MARPO_1179s0002 [Marchantia polymorpha]
MTSGGTESSPGSTGVLRTQQRTRLASASLVIRVLLTRGRTMTAWRSPASPPRFAQQGNQQPGIQLDPTNEPSRPSFQPDTCRSRARGWKASRPRRVYECRGTCPSSVPPGRERPSATDTLAWLGFGFGFGFGLWLCSPPLLSPSLASLSLSLALALRSPISLARYLSRLRCAGLACLCLPALARCLPPRPFHSEAPGSLLLQAPSTRHSLARSLAHTHTLHSTSRLLSVRCFISLCSLARREQRCRPSLNVFRAYADRD